MRISKQLIEQQAVDEKRSHAPAKRFGLPKTKLFILLQVLTLIVVIALGFAYFQEKSKNSPTADSTSAEIDEIKKSVGKHMKLDTDKQPTIATVKDVEALMKQNPTFYKNATNGNYLLIYPDKAILYDKSQDLILNVAPIVADTTGQSTATVEPTKAPTKK